MTKKKSKASLPTLPELRDDAMELSKAIHFESDFPCVLICTTFLEEAVGALLVATLADPDSCEELVSAQFNGPISSFRWRTTTAYCLGLISRGAFENLNVIRTIRNKFGHPRQSMTFQNQVVSDLCFQLKFPARHKDLEAMYAKNSTNVARSRFAAISCFLFNNMMDFHDEIIQPKGKIPKLVDMWDQSAMSTTSIAGEQASAEKKQRKEPSQ